jgi:hypothetical protein
MQNGKIQFSNFTKRLSPKVAQTALSLTGFISKKQPQ